MDEHLKQEDVAADGATANTVKDETGSNGPDLFEFTIVLEYDDLRSRQLGVHVYKNTAAYLADPRREVAGAKTRTLHLHVRRDTPVRWGMAFDAHQGKSVPSALVVLDVSFQRLGPSSRFKFAEFKIDIDDAPADDAEPEDSSHQPAVLGFQPDHFEGPILQVLGQAAQKFEIGVSDPSNVVSAKYTPSFSSPTVKEGSFLVHGVATGDPADSVQWVLHEDKVRERGIPPEISFGVVVACTPGRRFGARVSARANVLLDRFPTLTAGEKDDPLFFTPPIDMPQDDLQPYLTKLKLSDAIVPQVAVQIPAATES